MAIGQITFDGVEYNLDAESFLAVLGKVGLDSIDLDSYIAARLDMDDEDDEDFEDEDESPRLSSRKSPRQDGRYRHDALNVRAATRDRRLLCFPETRQDSGFKRLTYQKNAVVESRSRFDSSGRRTLRYTRQA